MLHLVQSSEVRQLDSLVAGQSRTDLLHKMSAGPAGRTQQRGREGEK